MAFSGNGSGTEADPYQITTYSELEEITNDLDSHYELQNDIQAPVDSEWEFPSTNYFNGSLKGGGYTIDGLRLIQSTTISIKASFIYNLAGEISNINFTNVHLVEQSCGIVRENRGTIDNVSIKYKENDITSATTPLFDGFGGLVQINGFGGTITNSYVELIQTDETMQLNEFGGVISKCKGQVENTTAKINIVADPTYAGSKIGGFASFTESMNDGIFDCGVNVAIRSDSSTKMGAFLGGLGAIEDSQEIKRCFAIGVVIGNSEISGFACGNNNWADNAGMNNYSTYIWNCYSNVDVHVLKEDGTGVGSGFMTNIYNLGEYANTGELTIFKQNYYSGRLFSHNGEGNLWIMFHPKKGASNTIPTFNTNYYNSSLIGDNINHNIGGGEGYGAIPKLKHEMEKQSFYTFDFSSVWEFNGISGYPYPTLQSVPETNNLRSFDPYNNNVLLNVYPSTASLNTDGIKVEVLNKDEAKIFGITGQEVHNLFNSKSFEIQDSDNNTIQVINLKPNDLFETTVSLEYGEQYYIKATGTRPDNSTTSTNFVPYTFSYKSDQVTPHPLVNFYLELNDTNSPNGSFKNVDSSCYHNGYIYGVDNDSGGLFKINENDYSDLQVLYPEINSNETVDVYGELQSYDNYIWAICKVGYTGTPYLIRINSDFSNYVLFELDSDADPQTTIVNINGTFENVSVIYGDGIYYIDRYSLDNFMGTFEGIEQPEPSTYRGEYINRRIGFHGTQNLYRERSNLLKNSWGEPIGMDEDVNFIYIAFTKDPNWSSSYIQEEDKDKFPLCEIHKYRKAKFLNYEETIEPVDFAPTSQSSNMVQNNEWLFFGASEPNKGYFGWNWGWFAVHKKTMDGYFLPHPDDITQNINSLHTSIRGDELYDVKSNGIIYTIDISDPTQWNFYDYATSSNNVEKDKFYNKSDVLAGKFIKEEIDISQNSNTNGDQITESPKLFTIDGNDDVHIISTDPNKNNFSEISKINYSTLSPVNNSLMLRLESIKEKPNGDITVTVNIYGKPSSVNITEVGFDYSKNSPFREEEYGFEWRQSYDTSQTADNISYDEQNQTFQYTPTSSWYNDDFYFHMPYVITDNGERFNCEPFRFTPIQPSSTIEASKIRSASATIKGEIPYSMNYSYITEIGIYYGTTSGNLDQKVVGEIGESFDIELSELTENTTYYCKAYVKNENVEATTEEMSFTTEDALYYLEGEVTKDDNPVEGADIMIVDMSEMIITKTSTDSSGKYEVLNLSGNNNHAVMGIKDDTPKLTSFSKPYIQSDEYVSPSPPGYTLALEQIPSSALHTNAWTDWRTQYDYPDISLFYDGDFSSNYVWSEKQSTYEYVEPVDTYIIASNGLEVQFDSTDDWEYDVYFSIYSGSTEIYFYYSKSGGTRGDSESTLSQIASGIADGSIDWITIYAKTQSNTYRY